MKHKILIVEDQFIEAKSLSVILATADYHVTSIERSVKSALKSIEVEKPDIVLLDIFLQGEETGIDLGRILQNRNIPFIYLSANSNRSTLAEVKATEPYGFLVKPFRAKDVLIMLDIALHLHKIRTPDKEKKNTRSDSNSFKPSNAFSQMIGKSENFLRTLELSQQVGTSDTSVLILGESGTGKELIAQSIHQVSSRRHKPFVVVNCGAIPANLIESELFGHEKGSFTGALLKRLGKFELANGGTIFLDEVGELPLELQVRFLRVLQEKEIEPIGCSPKKVDVRVIAATNRDMEEEIACGRFRLDLYYRLNVFPIVMPPLRERKNDIPLLANHFLAKYNTINTNMPASFSKTAIEVLQAHHWPGNIRELENTIQRSILLTKGNTIESISFTSDKLKKDTLRDDGKLKTMLENERDHILTVLESCSWKISGKGGAAELLDINASTLYSRIKKLGIRKTIA